MDLSKMSQAMAIQAVFKALAASEDELDQPWTPRRLGMRMALGGLHPCPCGTADEVADVFEQWANEADVDGFNIGSVTNPSSWEDVVDLLIPVLQERGLFWRDYDVAGGTFRENLLGQKELRDDHYGAGFKITSAQKVPSKGADVASEPPAAGDVGLAHSGPPIAVEVNAG